MDVARGLCADHLRRSAHRCGAGALSLWRARHAVGADFNRAKAGATASLPLGFVVWFFGFMVVGGEWFLMWQSHQCNGQEAAFKFYMAILGVLIFLNQPEAG